MKNKKWKTAKELMDELERDPGYVRLRAEKDEKYRRLEEQYSQLERPILEKLDSHGFQANSIQDAVKRYAPLSSVVVDILLSSLETCDDVRIRESLVRALGAAEKSFDGRPLVNCYEGTSDDNLRWAIVNTIVLARPHSIDEWLEKARKNPHLRSTLEDLGYS
jgi:hypothetical protein